MKKRMRAQASIEYMILIGFVTFGIISIVVIALFYSAVVRDEIKNNQISVFANKIITESERVFYAGSPSKRTVLVYIPEGVQAIEINDKSLIINYTDRTGATSVKEFTSNVNITGSVPTSPGLKRLTITAQDDRTQISSS
ncbi:hypothetical protein HYV49_01460 [Candidatus Pacearchaeota archaeon]|nr:hypothetical protein [Candidatus Pacearchaeota archaeon]